MKNNNFKKFAVVGMAALSIAIGSNAIFNNASEPTQPLETKVAATVMVKQADSFSMEHTFEFSNAGAKGELKEISHKGKIIGQVQKFADKTVIKSNLSKNELGEIYNDLAASGELPNVKIGSASTSSLAYAKESGAPQSRVNEIVGGSLAPDGTHSYKMSDVEQLLVGSSIAHREKQEIVPPSNVSTFNKIQAMRIQSNPHLYKNGPVNKVTPG